jgi:hypothetical protein
MHECPDIYTFQAAHPSAIVRQLNKVPPAILAWGLLLLSNAQPLAPPANDQPPPAVTLAPLAGDQQFVLHTAPLSSVEACTLSDASSALLTYQSGAGAATCRGDPPSLGVCSPPVGAQVPPPVPSAVVAPGIPHVQVPCVLPTSGPPRPDPNGLDEPSSFMGGRQYQRYGGSYGGPLRYHGGSHSQHHAFSFPSSGSTADYWHTYKFPGGIPLAVPSFIHKQSLPCPSNGGSPHASASVVSMLDSAAHPLIPLMHEDRLGSSALDLTPSLSAAIVPPVVPSAIVPPAAPVLPPVPVPPPPVVDMDSVGDSTLPVLAPVLIICLAEPFKLPPIVDAKAYLNLSNIIQYYLHHPEFSTQCSDNAIVTDSRNAKASAFWEGQIRVATQDSSLHFLFENKELMYDGKGFEMLAALNQNCHPNLVANAFTTLMLHQQYGQVRRNHGFLVKVQRDG